MTSASERSLVEQDGWPSYSPPLDLTEPVLQVDYSLCPRRGSRWVGQNMLEENAYRQAQQDQEEERGHG